LPFNGLLFLYRHVLRTEPPNITGVERARHSRRLPVVFSKAEATAVIRQLDGENRLIVSLLYGAGLRIREAVCLRVKDIDFGRHEITVRDSKGEQDRLTMLPHVLKESMARQITGVHRLHDEDLNQGYGEVYLPYALERKYPKSRGILSGSICFRRTSCRWIQAREKSADNQVNEQNIQRAVKTALRKAE
jgi:integrase